MKIAQLTILFSCLLLACATHKPRLLQPAPPGCTRLDDSTWIDERPLQNIAYWEYLGWLIRVYGRQSAEYQAAFPDTTGHGDLVKDALSDSDTMLQHKTYFVPKDRFEENLCCVTWQQLLRYNQWRTEMVYWMQIHDNNCQRVAKAGDLSAPHTFWDKTNADQLKALPPVPVYCLPESLAAQAAASPQAKIPGEIRTLCRYVPAQAYLATRQ